MSSPDDRPVHRRVDLPVVVSEFVPTQGMEIRPQRVMPELPVGGTAEERLRAMADDYFGALRPTTRGAYQQCLLSFAKFGGYSSIQDAIGAVISGGVGDAFSLISRWKTSLIEHGYASGTINLRLLALRSILGFAHNCGLVAWQVKIRPLKVQQKDMRGPGRDGVAKLFGACVGPSPLATRDRCLLRLLYNAALRRGEVTTLDMEHVDLERGTISPLRKGKEFRGAISVSPKVIEALREWIAVRGSEPGPLLYNFDPTAKASRQLTGDGVTSILHRLAKRGGLDPKVVRPHGLRHSGITTALDATNGNLREVMQFSGHSTPGMVIRYDDSRQNFTQRVALAVDEWDDVPDGGSI